MKKHKKTILVICTVIAALIIISGAAMAMSDSIVVQLTQKNASVLNDGIRLVTSDSLTDGTDLIKDSSAKERISQYDLALIERYEEALKAGYVYQYEMYLDDNYMHRYRYIGEFSDSELEEALFEDEYSVLNIRGNRFYIQWGYPGQFKEADSYLPELNDKTLILRLFSDENWMERSEILAKEQYAYIKNNIALPLYEEGTVLCSSFDNSIVRRFSDDEIQKALISENGVFVMFDDEIYVINRNLTDPDIPEILLRSQKDYAGDAASLNPEEYRFFSIDEWMEG